MYTLSMFVEKNRITCYYITEYYRTEGTLKNMLNICICNDDKTASEKLTLLVHSILKDYPIKLVCLESGESFLFHFLENPNYFDIILMDIEIGKLNGIQVMTKMRLAGCKSELIYLTALKGYVFDSFDTYPLNYILKGRQGMEKLRSVLPTAAKNAVKKQDDFIMIGGCKNFVKVDKKYILYIDIYNRQVLYHLLNNPPIESPGSLMQALEAVGRENFIQAHKSYIVNLHNVRHLRASSLTMIDGTELPIGRKFVTAFRERFSDFLSKSTIEV